MGHKGFDKQNNGMNTKANEVPVKAMKNPMFHGGAGLHEMLPTNQASMAVNDPEPSATQSGLRSSTSLTCFQDVNGIATKKVKIEVGMHSNAAINPTGSKYTRYQQAAHDKLRKLNPGAPTARTRLIERAGQSISIHAHGQQILESQYQSGSMPNLKTPDKNNHGKTLSPTAMGAPAMPPDNVRLHFAMVSHQLRERPRIGSGPRPGTRACRMLRSHPRASRSMTRAMAADTSRRVAIYPHPRRGQTSPSRIRQSGRQMWVRG